MGLDACRRQRPVRIRLDPNSTWPLHLPNAQVVVEMFPTEDGCERQDTEETRTSDLGERKGLPGGERHDGGLGVMCLFTCV